MTEAAQLLAKVRMPEKGIFAVRCPRPGFVPGQAVVVNLGYGPDIGVLLATEPYDPVVHGPSVPGYELLRAETDEDIRTVAANEALKDRICADLLRLAQELEVRLLHARLSLGRRRLFAWYSCPSARFDLSDAAREVGRLHGVQVMARRLGPRDEVRLVGALGPCGRPCCCATWLARCPGLGAERANRPDGTSAQPNGICGRFKCCFSFEGQPDATAMCRDRTQGE